MNLENNCRGPLQGLNVVDFGHYYAGPMAGMLLADQGANVIHIVRPGESELSPRQFRLFNRNKKVLTLELKTPQGKADALALIEKADVVIENFRPGVMKRLGLDYTRVKNTNPRLIYLSLPGFASTDKARAHIQAWEGVLSAASGVYTETSWFRQALNYPPVYSVVPQCSAYGAMHGAIAVTAALIAREKHRVGTVIEVPLVEAGLSGFAPYLVYSRTGPLLTLTEPGTQVPEALKHLAYSSSDSREVQEEKHIKAQQAMLAPFFRFYDCADGRKVFVCLSGSKRGIKKFLSALGVYRDLKDQGFVNDGPWEDSALGNNLSGVLNPERGQMITKILSDIFLTKTAEEWESFITGSGVLNPAKVRSRSEWLATEPMLRSGVLAQMDDGKSRLTVPGRVVDVTEPDGRLSVAYDEPVSITVRQAFDGMEKDTIANRAGAWPVLQKGDLLHGLKVVDLANVVAGPTASYVLAQYGADVIKADPPRDFHLPWLIKAMLEQNQGKRSLLMDIKTAPGREVFRRLVNWSDVVLHNILDDTALRLGCTHEQLQAINPHVVSCQLSSYGGTYRGGWEMRGNMDTLAQTVTGMPAQYGSLDEPQIHGATSCGDTLGGLILAFSAVLAAYQKRHTGYAGEARTSLVRVCNYIQLPYMIAENGHTDEGEVSGQFVMGESAGQRMYECSDHWIYVGAREDQLQTFSKLVSGKLDANEHRLEAAFLTRDSRYWLDRLDSAHIACHRVLNVPDIYYEQGVRQVDNAAAHEVAGSCLEVLCRKDHPCGYPVAFAAPSWVRVGENHSYYRLAPAPRLGANTREILRELGYSEDEVEDLVRVNVAYDYLPALGDKEKYFPIPEK